MWVHLRGAALRCNGVKASPLASGIVSYLRSEFPFFRVNKIPRSYFLNKFTITPPPKSLLPAFTAPGIELRNKTQRITPSYFTTHRQIDTKLRFIDPRSEINSWILHSTFWRNNGARCAIIIAVQNKYYTFWKCALVTLGSYPAWNAHAPYSWSTVASTAVLYIPT